jgi:hypothetical protein
MKISDDDQYIAVFFLSVLMIFGEIFRLVFFRHYAQDGLLLVIFVLFACYFNGKIKKKGKK